MRLRLGSLSPNPGRLLHNSIACFFLMFPTVPLALVRKRENASKFHTVFVARDWCLNTGKIGGITKSDITKITQVRGGASRTESTVEDAPPSLTAFTGRCTDAEDDRFQTALVWVVDLVGFMVGCLVKRLGSHGSVCKEPENRRRPNFCRVFRHWRFQRSNPPHNRSVRGRAWRL